MADGRCMSQIPEATGATGSSLRGWRRVVARVLAYWYVSVVALMLIGCLLAWVWLFSGGEAKAYWSCMDSQIAPFKDLGWQPQKVFLAADDACSPRPEGLTDEAALSEWIRHWKAQ